MFSPCWSVGVEGCCCKSPLSQRTGAAVHTHLSVCETALLQCDGQSTFYFPLFYKHKHSLSTRLPLSVSSLDSVCDSEMQIFVLRMHCRVVGAAFEQSCTVGTSCDHRSANRITNPNQNFNACLQTSAAQMLSLKCFGSILGSLLKV